MEEIDYNWTQQQMINKIIQLQNIIKQKNIEIENWKRVADICAETNTKYFEANQKLKQNKEKK